MSQIKQFLNSIREIPFFHKVLLSFFLALSLLGLFSLMNTRRPLPEKKESVKKEKAGFELFDATTWIKGEKELEVLEMRALKEQLQKELATFEHITTAYVLLDLSSRHTLGRAEKPKASIIVSLAENSVLTSSKIEAILQHVTGAVRGLEKNRVALSDTRGRVYRTIDQSVDVLWEPSLSEEVITHLPPTTEETQEKKTKGKTVVLILGLCGLGFSFWIIPKKRTKVAKKELPLDLRSVMGKVNLETLASLIKDQPPETIASMLAYLEEGRKELLLAFLPPIVREEVLKRGG